jgi:hypothetical protein
LQEPLAAVQALQDAMPGVEASFPVDERYGIMTHAPAQRLCGAAGAKGLLAHTQQCVQELERWTARW